MNSTVRKAILVFIIIAGIFFGRWFGYSWPIAILFGTGIFLIADGLSKPRRRASTTPQE